VPGPIADALASSSCSPPKRIQFTRAYLQHVAHMVMLIKVMIEGGNATATLQTGQDGVIASYTESHKHFFGAVQPSEIREPPSNTLLDPASRN
jgi:hypothetical protein